jgi:hypothetical protein
VLKELKYKCVCTVTIGDMNINVVVDSTNCNEYFNLFSGNGCECLINIYTLPILCLNHIFINYNEHSTSLINASVLQTDITDNFSTCIPFRYILIINLKKTILSKELIMKKLICC